MIYEKDFSNLFGLKRLVGLEKFKTPNERTWYKQVARVQRGRRRANKWFRSSAQWMSVRLADLPGGGAEASDYSTVFLPWGPEWTAQKCADLMQRKDRLLNNEYA